MSADRIHASASRLGFIDWARGFGALIMLQGHVTHSWMAKDRQGEPFYVLSQYLGGMPPAIFLFLTGVTLAFLMDSLSRKEPSARGRVVATLKRVRYFFVIALLFRLQLWAFALPYSNVADLWKVDILNCMGITVLALTWLAVLDTRRRVWWSGVMGLGIACLSPLLTRDLVAWLPRLAQDYLVADPNTFSLFPWGAFLAFGVTAGSILRMTPVEQYNSLLQWSFLLGLGWIYISQYTSNLPYVIYPNGNFWLDSPALTFIKTGLVMVMVSVGYVWMRYLDGRRSWVATLGQHSLPVYWVHVELVYGRLSDPFKQSLNEWQAVGGAVVVIVAMIVMAHYKGRYDRGEWPAKARAL